MKERSPETIIILLLFSFFCIAFGIILLSIADKDNNCQCNNNTTTIQKVLDGDTFLTEDGRYIRMARIDAPEEDELGYWEATHWLSSYEGKKIQMDCDKTGYYGRPICEVKYNGRNINDIALQLDVIEPYNK